jgi:1,4-dihydroxy-2-naphthoate octaprenyltransferase
MGGMGGPFWRGQATGRWAWSLFGCAHLEPVGVVTVLASLLAIGAGRGLATLWLTSAVLTGQLAVGWSNDWLDRENDRLAGRQDKPLARGQLPSPLVGGAALLAATVCIPLSLAYGLGAALAHFVALGWAFLYNIRLKATLVSIVPYLVSFGLLPVIVTLGLMPPRFPAAWTVAAGALLGGAGHFTQVLGDISTDRALGLGGLPQRLGQSRSVLAAATLLVLAMGVIAIGSHKLNAFSVISLASVVALSLAIVYVGRRHYWKWAFRLTLAAAAIAVLAFVLSA